MEFPEDIYENELIEAFDIAEPKAPVSSKLPYTLPHHNNVSLRQQTGSNVQAFHTKTNGPTLYPTFDDSSLGAPVAGTMTPSQLKQQQQHERIIAKVQEFDAPLSTQTYGEEELMTEVDLQKKQQQVEREMRVYQERFNYMAQALAGVTPYQAQKRTKREEERVKRQEKRHEAVEIRLQHQLERLEEKEERRARLQAIHHKRVAKCDCISKRDLVKKTVALDNQSN